LKRRQQHQRTTSRRYRSQEVAGSSPAGSITENPATLQLNGFRQLQGGMMALFIVLLILALIIFGVGFAVHLLWWLLIILLVIAVLGWLFGRRRA
jgi:predicted lipid-binding transport protein (Tim44 family)